MKTIVLLFGTVVFFASCKKDYTCECKTIVTENGVSTTVSIETTTSPIKMSKKNALDWCKNNEGPSSSGPGYEEKETCELK